MAEDQAKTDHDLLVSLSTTMEHIQAQISEIKVTVEKMQERQEQRYVRKEEFEPIKRIVYLLIGIIVSSVVGAVVAVVVQSGQTPIP